MPKGQKSCPKCQGAVTGPRTLVCPHCNQYIGKEKGESVPLDPATATTNLLKTMPGGYNVPAGKIQVVRVPAGKCPLTLCLTGDGQLPDDDTIVGWAMDVRQHMLNKREYLTNEALIYWARTQLNPALQFAPKGDEMEYLKLTIGEIPDITEGE